MGGLAVLVLTGLLMVAALVMNERYTTAGLLLAWVGWGVVLTWGRLRHSPASPPIQ